ncbi:MAG TPA: APC family permease [Acidimicrobiales bacterium]|nr:APC family permease [Acidimicrobiales bacterium]
MADPQPGRASTFSLWHLLIGQPRSSRGDSKERITPVEGLSALSLDALTSVAYGPEAIILALSVAGAGALHLILPITIAIVVLLAILVFSYRQVIDAYPTGGGAYAVSRANLGANVSLLAAASLVVDYTLTVAVSIAAGVASLQSAYPSLNSATIPLCLGILALITVMNLRGLGETARAFLLPTLLFIFGLLAVIAIGLIHPLGLNEPQPGTSQLPTTGLRAVSILLILKAFSAGCSALTGVEAIANGVPLFREPRAVRAKRTEMLLGLILGTMLLGLAVLAKRWQIGPRSGQTVLSQITAMAVGRNWAYYVISITITIVLALAANTSFGGLPVLASLVARDNYLPHLFTIRGDRQTFGNGILVLAVMSGALLLAVDGNTNTLIPLFAIGVFTGFTLSQTGLVVHWRRTRPPGWWRRATINGIVVLAIMSGALLVAVDGNTNTLIPLFAIGVFTGFTLSQTGLVVHWRKTRPPGWWRRAIINGLGAVITAVATLVFLISKFTEGAWVVVIAVPAFIFLFLRIHAYYDRVGKALRLDQTPHLPHPKRTIVIVPVNRLSRLTERAISEAESLGQETIAVTVVLRSGDEAVTWADSLQHQWRRWDCGVPLKVLHTDYASVVDPIMTFVDRVQEDHPDEQIVVLIPVIRPDKLRYRLLHNQLDVVLSAALRTRDDIIVARVLVPLEELEPEDAAGEPATTATTPAAAAAPVSDPSTPGHASQ